MFKSIRFRIISFLALLLTAAVLLSLSTTLVMLSRSQKASFTNSLAHTELAIKSLIDTRLIDLSSKVKLVGILPILRAVTESHDRATIRDTARSYKNDLKLPIFDVLGPRGRLMASVGVEYGKGQSQDLDTAIRLAARAGKVSALTAIRSGKIALFSVGPIGGKRDIAGVLVLGMFLDDAFAKNILDLSHADISFVLNGKVAGTSLPVNDPKMASLVSRLSQLKTGMSFENPALSVTGKAMSVPGLSPSIKGQMVLQLSMAQENATRRDITRTVLLLGVATLLLSLFCGVWIAGSLSSPIVELKNLTQTIIKTNDLSARAQVRGKDETAALATSINQFLNEIQDNHRKLADYSKNLEKMVEERTAELKVANDNITTLLNNLGQGFLVFEKNGAILPGSSKIAAEFFGGDPTGKTYASLFQLSEKDAAASLDLCGFTFDGTLGFSDLLSLLPTNFTKIDNKHIELKYRPILNEKGKLKQIICIASDKTDEVRFRAQAERERSMVEMIVGILKNRDGFQDFIFECKQMLPELGKALSKPDSEIDVNHVFRLMHSIKGGAAVFHLRDLCSVAHELESKLAKLREDPSLMSQVISTVKEGTKRLDLMLDTFLSDNEYILGKFGSESERGRMIPAKVVGSMGHQLMQSLGKDSPVYQGYVRDFVWEDLGQAFQKYASMVPNIAAQRGKKAHLELPTQEVRVNLDNYRSLVNSLVHVFRNAVDHGIEETDERESAGKPLEGKIQVSLDIKDDDSQKLLQITVRDDGRGIDPKRIRGKVVEKQLMTEVQAKTLHDRDIIQLVFQPGFSTADFISDLSGRGVGLDEVMHQARKLGGTASVESKLGSGAVFLIVVPYREGIVERKLAAVA